MSIGRSRSESPAAAGRVRMQEAQMRISSAAGCGVPNWFVVNAQRNQLGNEAISEHERMTVRPDERHVPFWPGPRRLQRTEEVTVRPPSIQAPGYGSPALPPTLPLLPPPPPHTQNVLPQGTVAVPIPTQTEGISLVHGIKRQLKPSRGQRRRVRGVQSPRASRARGQGNAQQHPRASSHAQGKARLVQTTKGVFRIPPGAGSDSLVTGGSPIGARIKKGKNGYGDLVRNRPPVNVWVPDGFDIGMLEILTFFPNWLQIPDVIARAVRNGWLRKDMAKAQLHAIAQLDQKSLLTTENRIQKQISDGCKTFASIEGAYKSKEFREAQGLEDNLTAVDWELRGQYEEEGREPDWGHCKLATIHGVVPSANWPKNEDRLLLTQCLEFAALNNGFDFDTSHIGWMIDNLNFDMPFELDAVHDKNALDRLRANVADPLN